MKWTEIDVRPSVDGMDALVLESDGSMYVTHWDADAGEFSLNDDYFESDLVTHWMPLPELPSGFLER